MCTHQDGKTSSLEHKHRRVNRGWRRGIDPPSQVCCRTPTKTLTEHEMARVRAMNEVYAYEECYDKVVRRSLESGQVIFQPNSSPLHHDTIIGSTGSLISLEHFKRRGTKPTSYQEVGLPDRRVINDTEMFLIREGRMSGRNMEGSSYNEPMVTNEHRFVGGDEGSKCVTGEMRNTIIIHPDALDERSGGQSRSRTIATTVETLNERSNLTNSRGKILERPRSSSNSDASPRGGDRRLRTDLAGTLGWMPDGPDVIAKPRSGSREMERPQFEDIDLGTYEPGLDPILSVPARSPNFRVLEAVSNLYERNDDGIVEDQKKLCISRGNQMAMPMLPPGVVMEEERVSSSEGYSSDRPRIIIEETPPRKPRANTWDFDSRKDTVDVHRDSCEILPSRPRSNTWTQELNDSYSMTTTINLSDNKVPALNGNDNLSKLDGIEDHEKVIGHEFETTSNMDNLKAWELEAGITVLEENEVQMGPSQVTKSYPCTAVEVPEYSENQRDHISTAPSQAGTTSSKQSNHQYDYTVKRSSRESSKEETVDVCKYFYACSAKWVISMIIAVLVLFCVTANKLCLLVIGHQYTLLGTANFSAFAGNRTSRTLTGKNVSSKEAIFIMLVLILMVPQGVSLLYAIWGRRRSHPWPSKRAVKWILFGGTIEVTSLCFLCVCVPTVLGLPPDLFVLFMTALFLVPTLWQAGKVCRKWRTRLGKIQLAIFILSAVLQLEGVLVLINSDRITRMDTKIGIPIALFLLSAAWSPKVRKLQTEPVQRTRDTLEFNRGTAESDDGREQENSAALKIKKKSARGKAAILMSLLKVILTPLVSLLFCRFYNIADITKLRTGFLHVTTVNPAYRFFLIQIFSTFGGYHLAWLACSMCVQQVGFALPLTLATPLAIIITQHPCFCGTDYLPFPCEPKSNFHYIIAVGLFMWVAQFLSTGYYVWKSNGYVMGRANHLFWLPSYNGALLEPYLLLNRRNQVTDDDYVTQEHLSRDTYLFICTTMYHEEDYEMEQLLDSLHDIDLASKAAGRHVESHIFFDGCINADVLTSYILQLVSLVEGSLKVQIRDCEKMKTPYGMQLRWELPGGMPITVHLKDNSKVKNKKRWSQVMYMSYVLDYKKRTMNIRDDQSFILTTDADVKFQHESMEALIDYMLQDDKIGAVCGRTHPMGKGPLVWYQIFDYAIGHWFMKVANHMFGSVLCCPGCFSLYRCQAIRDVLPTYSTTVSEAFEFLTKDMGEDRWMCTLMVQAGWRLMYCAAAEDMTYCPTNFDEFYKQRRRWIPSTLANLSLLISEWRVTLRNNQHISFLFIIFQMFLLCSTLIGPSTVILVIVGGMVYSGLGVDEISSTIIMSLITVVYGLVCLFLPQDVQLKVAKVLTFVFAIVMILVTIGVAAQIANELEVRRAVRQPAPTTGTNTTATTVPISAEQVLPAGVSTLYLGGLVGIFLITALMHPTEAFCLINGIWYLLCLPSGYLLLSIYSVVNMTDRSWGTREGKVAKTESESPLVTLWNAVKSRCTCCLKPLAKLASGANEKVKRKPSEKESNNSNSDKDKEDDKEESTKDGKRRRRRRHSYQKEPMKMDYKDDTSSDVTSSYDMASRHAEDERDGRWKDWVNLGRPGTRDTVFDQRNTAGRLDGYTHPPSSEWSGQRTGNFQGVERPSSPDKESSNATGRDLYLRPGTRGPHALTINALPGETERPLEFIQDRRRSEHNEVSIPLDEVGPGFFQPRCPHTLNRAGGTWEYDSDDANKLYASRDDDTVTYYQTQCSASHTSGATRNRKISPSDLLVEVYDGRYFKSESFLRGHPAPSVPKDIDPDCLEYSGSPQGASLPSERTRSNSQVDITSGQPQEDANVEDMKNSLDGNALDEHSNEGEICEENRAQQNIALTEPCVEDVTQQSNRTSLKDDTSRVYQEQELYTIDRTSKVEYPKHSREKVDTVNMTSRDSSYPSLPRETVDTGLTISSQEDSAYASEGSTSLPSTMSSSYEENGPAFARRIPPQVYQRKDLLAPLPVNTRRYTAAISEFGSSVSLGESCQEQLTVNAIDVLVEDWLTGDFRIYVPYFKQHGYDTLRFIGGMTEKDLDTIGVKRRGHRQKLTREVKRIPKVEIEEGVPDNVETWLEDLGLGEYWPHFEDNSYTEPSDLEDLKSMGKDLVQETFKVHKTAHITMLWQAIRKLQYPNTGQVKIRQARRELGRLPTHHLETDNGDNGAEFDFWDGLRQAVLMPELAGFDGNTELKEKLADLRNSTLMVFLITNVLWMVIIMVLVRHNKLKVLGVDVVGLAFLTVYGTIMLLQFFAMIAHRVTTAIHVLARAPWVCGSFENDVHPSVS